MTEEEWLNCSNIWELTRFLDERSERQLRLFARACCKRFVDEQAEELFRRALGAVERRAEGLCNDEELRAVHAQMRERANEIESTLRDRDGVIISNQRSSIANALSFAASPTFESREVSAGVTSTFGSLVFYACSAAANPTWERTQSREETDAVEKAELAEQLAVIKDIFGNPFRPPPFAGEWRTSTAMSLARDMYEAGDFSAMPILADALQDAGCDSDDLLSHCRDPHQVHVRGCWVVDLVLGKS